jgi:hypothetical protein
VVSRPGLSSRMILGVLTQPRRQRSIGVRAHPSMPHCPGRIGDTFCAARLLLVVR